MLHSQITNESDLHSPKSHASSHQNNKSDEINVNGLSGELADVQPPKFATTDLKPDVIPSLMQTLWQLDAIITTLESKIEILAAKAGVEFPV